jgi:DNA-binding MarR family transcriptional regulator
MKKSNKQLQRLKRYDSKRKINEMTKENLTKRQQEVLDLVAEHQPIGCNGIREIESPELVGNSAAGKSSSIQGVLKRLEQLGLIQAVVDSLETQTFYNLTEKGVELINSA